MRQLREHLGILGAPVARQRRWATEHHFFIDELMLGFFDMFPGFMPRLREAGFVTPAVESILKHLEQQFQSMRAATSVGHPLWIEWDLVATAPEWQRVRELASQALDLLAVGDENDAVIDDDQPTP